MSNSEIMNEGTTELAAVLIAVTHNEAKVLTVDEGRLLPNGPLSPIHRSLQAGVRQWVERQTHQPLGYVEQLYTFVDTNRTTSTGHFLIYIGYMGLVREEKTDLDNRAKWRSWYHYFPWEDHRDGRPEWIDEKLIPHFKRWVDSGETVGIRRRRQARLNMCWGLEGYDWNEEYVLYRYELLYESGLIPESQASSAAMLSTALPSEELATYPDDEAMAILSIKEIGAMMNHDHRRVLASAMTRLRAKIKYRPVIFELMPETFTLYQLQQSMEALGGILLHKPNFRRFITQQNILEETAYYDSSGPGRPARLYRFRDDILLERSLSGSKLPISR